MDDRCHDDAITCLAMGLFVMMFSYKKLESAQDKDKAILNAYMMTGAMQVNQNHSINNKPITPNNGLPFYNKDNKEQEFSDAIEKLYK
jgi:hypothetical protein